MERKSRSIGKELRSNDETRRTFNGLSISRNVFHFLFKFPIFTQFCHGHNEKSIKTMAQASFLKHLCFFFLFNDLAASNHRDDGANLLWSTLYSDHKMRLAKFTSQFVQLRKLVFLTLTDEEQDLWSLFLVAISSVMNAIFVRNMEMVSCNICQCVYYKYKY